MFKELEKINTRPEPFEFYTAPALWTDEYTSEQMLSFHLNDKIDAASRNAEFIEKSIEWITSRFNIKKGTKIADFGCGPGLYTTGLGKKQADVTGIDFSKRSIEYAKKTAERESLPISYINQNYMEFKTEKRFHLILMIMCDFCALSPIQRKNILTVFYNLLEPEGFVLLDAYLPGEFDRREERANYQINLLNSFWSPNKYYGFLNTFKYEKEKLILDKYTIIEQSRTQTIYNWFQCFTPETLKKEFTDCSFTIEEILGDVAGSPYNSEGTEFAVIAKK